MSSVFFAALATAAAGVISGDSSPPLEQLTAPAARPTAASPAPIVLRRTERRTEMLIDSPQGTHGRSTARPRAYPRGTRGVGEFPAAQVGLVLDCDRRDVKSSVSAAGGFRTATSTPYSL